METVRNSDSCIQIPYVQKSSDTPEEGQDSPVLAGIEPKEGGRPIEPITMEMFQAGDVFRVYYRSDQYAELVLTSIREGKYALPDVFQKPFSLLFRSERNVVFEPGTYTMVHHEKGEIVIGISAVVSPPGEQDANYYEAVFS